MNDMPMILGRHDVDVDSDGEFILPKEWREALVVDGTVCLLPDLHEKCLMMISKSLLDEEISRLRRQKNDKAAQSELKFIEAEVQLLRSDRAGRVAIPGELRGFAGIGSSASLLGSVRCVKIWATEQLKANRQDDVAWDSLLP